jgi:hypothetical protein
MDEFMRNSALLLDGAGVWVAFLFTLMIFSGLAGDNSVYRLAQHILVGAGLGYAGVLAVRHVLLPRLITPILSGEGDPFSSWIPLLLAAILLLAGLDRIFMQTAARMQPLPAWRRGVHGSGRIVVALLLGIGLGAGIMGALQGTLIPQYLRAAQTGFSPGAPGYSPLVGIFTLLLTTAAFLHLFVDPERHLRHQPAYARNIMIGWLWLGQRALWFAAGLIFARLVASRLSLLIARVGFLVQAIHDSWLWTWLGSMQ